MHWTENSQPQTRAASQGLTPNSGRELHTGRLFQPGNVHPLGSHKEPPRCLAWVSWFNFPLSHGNFWQSPGFSHPHYTLTSFQAAACTQPRLVGFPLLCCFSGGCLFTKSCWRETRGKIKPSKAENKTKKNPSPGKKQLAEVEKTHNGSFPK